MPAPGERCLDHIAHWVPDPELKTTAAIFTSLGFVPTPRGIHIQRAAEEPGAPVVPSGSANRCIMLRGGYLEFLTPVPPADTAVTRELEAGIERYTGVHLIAFGAADTESEHARLSAHGLSHQPLVALQREAEVDPGDGGGARTETLRFLLARAAPGTMAEGRVQFLTHLTPEYLWQPRHVSHPNTAEELAEVWIVVEDLEEALDRYATYLDTPATRSGAEAGAITLARGRVLLFTPEGFRARLPEVAIPCLPFIAGYGLATATPARAREMAERTADAVVHEPVGGSGDEFAVMLPPEVGGTLLFSTSGRLGSDAG